MRTGHNSPSARSCAVRIAKYFATALAVLLLFSVAPQDFCLAEAQKTAILDRVVAVVGDHAILASDVDDEMRFAALQGNEPPADNTPQRALERVIDRTLIDEQRALQPGLAEVPQQEVNKTIDALRASIPDCAEYQCKTDAGWEKYLAAHGFTPAEVKDRIRERLAVLKFIDLRFSVAARVPNEDVQNYYNRTFKPQLERAHAAVPAFNAVAPRIREILRQRQVDSMVDEWIKGLRSEDQVRILDSAYAPGASGQ